MKTNIFYDLDRGNSVIDAPDSISAANEFSPEKSKELQDSFSTMVVNTLGNNDTYEKALHVIDAKFGESDNFKAGLLRGFADRLHENYIDTKEVVTAKIHDRLDYLKYAITPSA